MKKRNGFTLVELLAVIVILAIILVIAIPQIIKTIDAARLGAFRSTAKLLLSQAEKQKLVDETLNVSGEAAQAPSWTGAGNADGECGELAKLGSDYSACTITWDDSLNSGKGGYKLNLTGDKKFKNYTCVNATADTVDGDNASSNCDKRNS